MTTQRLGIRLDDELADKLQRLRARGYNISELARQALVRMTDELLAQSNTP